MPPHHLVGDFFADCCELDRIMRVVDDAAHLVQLTQRSGHRRHFDIQFFRYFLGMRMSVDRDQFRDRFQIIFQTL